MARLPRQMPPRHLLLPLLLPRTASTNKLFHASDTTLRCAFILENRARTKKALQFSAYRDCACAERPFDFPNFRAGFAPRTSVPRTSLDGQIEAPAIGASTPPIKISASLWIAGFRWKPGSRTRSIKRMPLDDAMKLAIERPKRNGKASAGTLLK